MDNIGDNRVSKLATIVDDKTIIAQLIRENSNRIKLIDFKDARADIWQYFRLVCIDGQTLPYAVCIRCLKPVSYKAREGTGGLHRHPCSKHAVAAALASGIAIPVSSYSGSSATNAKRPSSSSNRGSNKLPSNPSSFIPVESQLNQRMPNVRPNLTFDQICAGMANTLTKLPNIALPYNFDSSLPMQYSSQMNESDDRDLPNEILKLFCIELIPIEILENGSFLRLAQELINFGANHGPVSFDQMQVNALLTNAYDTSLNQLMDDIRMQNNVTFIVDLWSHETFNKHFVTLWIYYLLKNHKNVCKIISTKDITHINTFDELIDHIDLIRNEIIGPKKDYVYLFDNDYRRFEINDEIMSDDHYLFCVNHELQNIFNEFFKIKEFSDIINEMKKFANSISNSDMIGYNEISKKVLSLIDSNCWHLRFELFGVFKEIWFVIEEVFTEEKCQNLNYAIIDEIATFFASVKDAFNYLCIEKKEIISTLNLVTLCKVKLENHCKINDSESKLLKMIKEKLLSQIEKSNLDHPLYLMAVCLDPRFKKLKMLSETQREETYERIRKLIPNSTVVTNVIKIEQNDDIDPSSLVETVVNIDANSEGSDEVKSNKRIKMSSDTIREAFNEFMDESNEQEKDELQKYLNMNVGQMEPFEFWLSEHANHIPKLRSLAERILSIPAASLKCCKYSDSGENMCIRRNALNPRYSNQILTLHTFFT